MCDSICCLWYNLSKVQWLIYNSPAVSNINATYMHANQKPCRYPSLTVVLSVYCVHQELSHNPKIEKKLSTPMAVERNIW